MQLGGFVTPEFKEWKVTIRRIINKVVLEYNEKLVEERVEQAILQAAWEGRRADNGVGIEMFWQVLNCSDDDSIYYLFPFLNINSQLLLSIIVCNLKTI